MKIEQGSRAYGAPVMVRGTDGQAEQLRRASLAESDLQDFIAHHPYVLPLPDLDPAYQGSVAVARELRTGAGPVDILLVNPHGRLTLVETKLWCNPESRREAVAQLLDYATRLTEWDFTDLDQEVRAAARSRLGREMGVLDVLRHQGRAVPPEDEARLVDAIQRNLRDGRLLLLLVGDGIRESAERLVQGLNRYARWPFTLALVEVAVYEVPPPDPGDPPARLVVPQVVVRTREIHRHVIEVRSTGAAPEVTYRVQGEDAEASGPETVPASEEHYLKQLPDDRLVPFVRQLLEACRAEGLEVKPEKAGLQVVLPGRDFRLFLLRGRGKVQAPEWLVNDLEAAGIHEKRAKDITCEHVQAIARLLEAKIQSERPQLAAPLPSLERLQESYEQFMDIVRGTASRIRDELGHTQPRRGRTREGSAS